MRRVHGVAAYIGLALVGMSMPPVMNAALGQCELQKLTASDAAMQDFFGGAVSISKDFAVIGADWNDFAGGLAGSAYVFRRDESGTPSDPTDDLWIEEARLVGGDTGPGDFFGTSVSIDGSRLVVGAVGDDDAWPASINTDSGAAYVFRRDDNGTPSDPGDDFWIEEAKLTAHDAAPGDFFGISVSISADSIVVGAHGDDHAGTQAGAAYVFRRDPNGTPLDQSDDFWVEEAKLTASDAAGGDIFGWSVSISGDRVVAGAFWDDDAGSQSGSAYVFWRNEGGTPSDPIDNFWVEEAKLTASDGAENDAFGESVAISGPLVLVGAFTDDDGCPPGIDCETGSAYVFRHQGSGTRSDPYDHVWVEEAKLTASEAHSSVYFGDSVSVTADWAVVGAPGPTSAGLAGAAYLYHRDDSGTPSDPTDDLWIEEAMLIGGDTELGDQFGISVAISDDQALIGAWRDDDACLDNPYCTSGAAYVFSLGDQCANLADYAAFQNCFSGEGVAFPMGCDEFDLDHDTDVDLTDHERFLLAFPGP